MGLMKINTMYDVIVLSMQVCESVCVLVGVWQLGSQTTKSLPKHTFLKRYYTLYRAQFSMIPIH